MVELAAGIRVEEIRVALAPAPEDVVLAAERDGGIERGFDLRAGVGNDVEVGIRRRAVHISAVREQVCRAPEELYAGRPLTLPGKAHHVLEALLALGDGATLGREIAIVEAVIRHGELREELERGVECVLGGGDRIGLPSPRLGARPRAERIGPVGAERVPIANGEPQMLAHRLVADAPIGVVGLEGERIVGVRPLEANHRNTWKEFAAADKRLCAHRLCSRSACISWSWPPRCNTVISSTASR